MHPTLQQAGRPPLGPPPSHLGQREVCGQAQPCGRDTDPLAPPVTPQISQVPPPSITHPHHKGDNSVHVATFPVVAVKGPVGPERTRLELRDTSLWTEEAQEVSGMEQGQWRQLPAEPNPHPTPFGGPLAQCCPLAGGWASGGTLSLPPPPPSSLLAEFSPSLSPATPSSPRSSILVSKTASSSARVAREQSTEGACGLGSCY